MNKLKKAGAYILKQIRQNSLLAISIGVVYLWFGFLKFFPDMSSAEGLAKDTIDSILFGFIASNISIILLAIMEVTIGVFLLLNIFRKNHTSGFGSHSLYIHPIVFIYRGLIRQQPFCAYIAWTKYNYREYVVITFKEKNNIFAKNLKPDKCHLL